jgi:amidohydrolase
MELGKLKEEIRQDVEAHRHELIDLSLRIHSNPEVGWQEEMSSKLLADYLEKNGFQVERGIYDLPTSFRALYGQGKPVVAIMAEYDALPGIGHGCGHNIIGTAAVGAAIAAKLATKQGKGTIQVIGTPAEECLGGKVVLAERGAFAGLDAAMMLHPRGKFSWLGLGHLAMISLDVEFWGKPAHASAAPWDGVNALEALIQSFNGINSLRQHIRTDARIHGIICDGGKVANVVPEHAAGNFMVRAADDAYLEELSEKVIRCFQAASLYTGARLEYKWGLKCSAMRHNHTMLHIWADNMKTLGRQVDGYGDEPTGSVDMGNVSAIVPSIHPFIAISPERVTLHSAEFAIVASSDEGMKALIDGSKALAMTAADMIYQPRILSQIQEEFMNTGI